MCEGCYNKNALLYLNIKVASGPRAREFLKQAVKSLQSGVAVQYAKPLLAAEIRRIIPTSVGVPMEFAHYTAAVAGATINGKGLTCFTMLIKTMYWFTF